MPLLLDSVDDPKAPIGFDLPTSSTLFWRPVPVLLKQQDREDQHEALTVRILTGFARQNHNLRILRIHISNDSDLYFLHTLEVSEEDFQSLKNDQGILVDFASFPGKIISLLEKCVTAQPGDSPRFQAVMMVRANESLFKIVEINDFKQLPHITLAFRPGNDSVVKQFLAFRLTEVKSNCQELSDTLDKTKDERDSASSQLTQCRQQLADLREQYDKHLLEVQAQAKTQQASAHEERLREKAQLKDQHERERGELEKRFRDQIAGLNARLGELDSENRKLREIKYELDTKVSELSHKLGSAEGSNRSLDDESARLRASNQQLSMAKHELEIQLNETRAKLLALEEKAQSQADVMEQQRGRVRDMESAMRQAEQRCADLRDAVAAAEARGKEAQAEVLKGNQIIEKLTTDLRLAKEKTKRKAAIIVRQEEELQQREAALANAMRDLTALGQQLESQRVELSGLQGENEALRGKLEDSRQQLQDNHNMIRWLNEQVTQAQLHGSGGVVPGSRYTFRPASTLASGLPAPSVAATPAVGLLAGPATHASAYKTGGATGSRYAAGIGGGGAAGTGTGSVPSTVGVGPYGSAATASSGQAGPAGGGVGFGQGSGFGAVTGGGLQGATTTVPGTAFRSNYGAGSHVTPGLGIGGSGMGSAVSTPAAQRVGGGGPSSAASSLSFGAGVPSSRVLDPKPAAGKYGLVAGGGFGSGAGGAVGSEAGR
ncbi:hypothetical protein PLESTB_001468100 [Pleodorina starrii]|uniref:Spindle assembly abnormal protein 6 N-terminal domain-containing protein n=1 Tax=Pleodorina starrii TaxID=330485 RepID=A0A9W6F869_9CHLO|nr:hypothetical protein PLESTM_001686400 [Pleodorina starrii]GLC59266.1 hypothetical protein PLESTB_001468100 [Pleodorina starrii]GLC74831.1 hypothetical protein PLESTF_001560700 [Pleodorina starrii]